jgi:nucleotide-binding universal stress UspA family protein
LDRCQQAARIAGLATQSVLLQGDPSDEIVREGKRTSADFMVMGRHGHGASNPWTLGSVVERVLRRAPCPVVVVRPVPRHRGEGPGQVLCGLDLGETSASTLQYAVGVAKALEADLQVLHVAAEEGAERAGSDLAATVARASTAKAPRIQRNVVTGEPHEQILGLAGQNDIGLIVVGSHGGVVVDRPFLGSTVLHLLRHADCPVLVVPAHLTETREHLVVSRPGERDADSRHRR